MSDIMKKSELISFVSIAGRGIPMSKQQTIACFVQRFMKENSPSDCLSLGMSLVTTTVAHLKGDKTAQAFIAKFNQLLADALEMPVETKTIDKPSKRRI